MAPSESTSLARRNVVAMLEALENRRLFAATLFVQRNLVSDGAVPAETTDAHLKNPWGLANDDNGPLWVADNGTGVSTLYRFSDGKPLPLVVNIHGSAGKTHAPVTGTVYNKDESGFKVSQGGKSAASDFIFASEDGTIAAWSGKVALNDALVKIDHSSSGAIYKGLAQAKVQGKRYLYAADFGNGVVEAYDRDWKRVNSFGNFVDPTLPKGYVPFNVQNIGGKLYVTYAKKESPTADDEEHGAGLGRVTVFNASGGLVRRLQSGPWLDAPWGVVQAPSGFGDVSGDILVGNFGSGRIDVFNSAGKFVRFLQGKNSQPIVIDGLWGLRVGSDAQTSHTVFFSAGPNDEVDGLLGSLRPQS